MRYAENCIRYDEFSGPTNTVAAIIVGGVLRDRVNEQALALKQAQERSKVIGGQLIETAQGGVVAVGIGKSAVIEVVEDKAGKQLGTKITQIANS